jgi:glucose/arabinose dehydrogenase
MKNLYTCLKAFLFSFVLFHSTHLAAQPHLAYSPVVTGLTNPVDAVTAPGDGRMFIAQQNGSIRIRNGATATTEFLNINALLPSPLGSEQGLLSLAFDPAYAANGYFFVLYTASNGNITLARFQRSAGNASQADPASRQELLSIAKPGTPYFTNHNGGKIIFGPDGMLYMSTGDGGSGGDPFGNAQNLNSLLGKMLRLNVSIYPGTIPFYQIPADNPFAAPADGARDEIYSYGLRNPWRWSFDRLNGDMWIGDVGQGAWEEVNWKRAGTASGENFGWDCYEGNHIYTSGCTLTDTVAAIYEYGHNFTTGGLSITGGYVYRGTTFPSLQGYYITTDYVSGNLWLIGANGAGGWNVFFQDDLVSNVAGFAENDAGVLYAINRSLGRLDSVVVLFTTPVQFSSFTATGYNGYNKLQWETSSESATDYFAVEYSTDGINFSPAGTVDASGAANGSSYEFRHDIRFSGYLYYRLVIHNDDGSLNYSQIARIKSGENMPVKIFSNIVTNGNLRMEIAEPVTELQLINSTGAMLYRKSLQSAIGIQNISLPSLPGGVYFIWIKGKNISYRERIIVQ